MTVPARHPNGRLIAGGPSLNAGGRPTSTLQQVREALLPDLPLFLERLAELTQSSNETIRLQALREILDRLLGRSAVFVDTTHTRVDIGAMYLAALKRANSHAVPSEPVIDGNSNGVGAASEIQ
jgi:hypothetical protein